MLRSHMLALMLTGAAALSSMPSRAPPDLVRQLIDGAAQLHAKECDAGARDFGVLEPGSQPFRTFSDECFWTHCVGDEKVARHEVRDAEALVGPTRVHATREPMLGDDEVDALVAECRAAMDGGVKAHITYADRTNLAVVHVGQLPGAQAWLSRRAADTFFPMVGDRYGIDPASLRVFDSIIIRYDAADGQDVRLPVHRDVSLISLNIALSSPGLDFDGGGTFFEGFYDEDLELTDDGMVGAAASVAEKLALPRGHALCHPSGLRHGAHRITRGERWVMIVFILKEDVVHAPRRAADLAHQYQSRGELGTAASIWQVQHEHGAR